MSNDLRKPSVIPVPYLRDASPYFLCLRPLGHRVWLDSGKPHSDYGRYDVLSAAPREIFTNPTKVQLENTLANIHQQIDLNFSEHQAPFIGGILGYFNYEYNYANYSLNATQLAPSMFGLFDWSLIQDHDLQKAYLIFLPNCAKTLQQEILQVIQNAKATTAVKDSYAGATGFQTEMRADLARSDYLSIVQQIKSYIAAGDTYQINFSQRFSGRFSGREDLAYLALRQALPSPFSAFLELGEDCVLSLSPERFIQIKDGVALTQPIKGTAPRGRTIAEDEQLANALKNSEKNRAENLMIVDLLRNDFSRSCLPYSVKTPALFTLESFANVHHLVSTVTGKLKPDVTPLEFFLACFPGGSITGAPKRRSMQIIRQLEAHPRNIYCGSVVQLSANGHFDSNIAIRTLLISEENIYCWGGGGIVHDSDPIDEYQESLQKVNILMETLAGAKPALKVVK